MKKKRVDTIKSGGKSAVVIGYMFVFALIITGCAKETDDSQNSYSGSSISSAATAYSRKMDWTIINWNEVG